LVSNHVALIVAQDAERGPHRPIVGVILQELLEILARVRVAPRRAPHSIEHEVRFDRFFTRARGDRRDRRFGGGVVAGHELRAREQDPCGRAVLARDLAELRDRGLVIAGDELVAAGGEVRARQVRRRAHE